MDFEWRTLRERSRATSERELFAKLVAEYELCRALYLVVRRDWWTDSSVTIVVLDLFG